MTATAVIAPDRIRPFDRRHPWVFAGAIEKTRGSPSDGEIVDLATERGQFLARGYWNNQSQIRVHVLTWDESEEIDEGWWESRLRQAIFGRGFMPFSGTAYRLVNAESDGLPGLVVDRYGDYLILQALTLGIDQRKTMLARLLDATLHPFGIYERSDLDVRAKEGLQPSVGVLMGSAPPASIDVEENGLRFMIDVYEGHKTGFYLDQRDNREALRRWLRADVDRAERSVLNCFSYSGGFAVYGLAGGAKRVVNVDASADALELAKQNVALNGFQVSEQDYVIGDVFQVLRQYRSAGTHFDAIILDPPKFAQSQKQVESATRGYKDINLLAFELLNPGGLLFTFSCSGAIDADLFQKVVFGALIDSGRDAHILERLNQAADHPVALTFPEGQYLKGLVCRVW